MSDSFTIHQHTPALEGWPRGGNDIRLIVVHSDPRPARDALVAFSNSDGSHAPHYHIARDGTIVQLIPEHRAARHSGLASWAGRRRNVDLISVGVALEHTPGAPYEAAQVEALAWLAGNIRARYDLPDTDLLGWEPDPQQTQARRGVLLPIVVSPWATTLAPAMAGLPLFGDDQPAAMPHAVPPRAVLGPVEADPQAARALWAALQHQAYSLRGEGFRDDWAFHRHAAHGRLGVPLARNAGETERIQHAGKQYGFQVYTGDTLFNEVPLWRNVLKLSDSIGTEIPRGGLARLLLEASYRASGGLLHPGWSFHQVAVHERLGPPLGGSYRISVAGHQYALQVFAGDTLYTPIGTPEAATNWRDVRRLSQTPPGDLYHALWAETYKPAGATYQPDSPFHQVALRERLGAPLGDVMLMPFAGTEYRVQVFSYDTLYLDSEGGIRRQSALPIAASEPLPATVTPLPAPERPVVIPIGGPPRPTADWPPKPPFAPLPNTAARQALFGRYEFVHEPRPGNREHIRILGSWVQEQIVRVHIPQLAHVRGAPGDGVILFHRLAAAQLQALWAAWEAAGLLDRVLTWEGSFVPRFIRGSTRELSNHAFGTAFDVNVTWNGFGALPALVGQRGSVRELVPIAHLHGFYWGGHFSRIPDGMHFEVAVLQ